MKNFKFKKIKSDRPIRTYFASEGKEIKSVKIPNRIFWKVHEATPMEFFYKKNESSSSEKLEPKSWSEMA